MDTTSHPFALPLYTLDTFTDCAVDPAQRSPELSTDALVSSRHLGTVGSFPALPLALRAAEEIARDMLEHDSEPNLARIVRIEIRASYPAHDGDAPAFVGIVDALERVSYSNGFAPRFRWRMESGEEVQRGSVESRAESARDSAENILRRAYFDDVRSYALDIMRAVADGEITDAEGLRERLDETVDGCQRVIYTSQALDTLRWTESDDAGFEDMGSDFLDGLGSMAEVYTRAAYFALRADISSRIGGMDPADISEHLSEFYARTLADFEVDDSSTYPAARAEDAESVEDEIRDGFARCVHALAWADCAERYGLANLSGCEIMDMVSDTSDTASEYALRVFEDLQARERKRAGESYSIGADFLARIQPEAEEHARTSSRGIPSDRTTAERFGHALAMEHLGHGVAWTDDNPAHGLERTSGEYHAEFAPSDFGLSPEEARERAEKSDNPPEGQWAEGYTLPGYA